MASISGVFNETTQKLTAFQTSVDNMHLNMGSVINTNDIGKIKFASEDFGNSLQSMVDSYNSASSSIAEGNEIFQNNLATLNSMLEAAGIEENTATYNEIMSKIPEITTATDTDLKEAFTGIINTIQEDALGTIPSLIEQARNEWDNLDVDTKTELRYQGIENKDAYVASVVREYEANVLIPMEEQINNSLKEMNLDEEGVMVQKAQELYDSLFYYDYKWDLGGGERTFKMSENWRQILEDANLVGISAEFGENATSAFANAINSGTSVVEEAMTKLGNDSWQSFHDSAMEYGSPSKAMIQFGEDTVIGYNKGIEENSQSTLTVISKYAQNTLNKFSEMIQPLEQIGKNAMEGLLDGMSSIENSLYSKAEEIADNIAKTIKTALDIHSPSRVMFELGDYTMQGFQNGIANLYQPILRSVKDFTVKH